MILRKPYAFLIKYFKLIHLILSILMIIFYTKLSDLHTFFNEYINDGFFTIKAGVVKQYASIGIYFIPIAIIAITTVIIWLLKLKEKPIRYYLITIGCYLLELVVLVFGSSLLSNIEMGTIDATVLSVYNDFIPVFLYLPIPIIIISIGRTVGFNVKQFNFKKDLMELDITDSDSEEFELEFDVDTEDIKAKFNRRLRFFKYTYLENKKLFIGGVITFILCIILLIVGNIASQEKIYKEHETFNAYNINLNVDSTYLTDYGSNGQNVNEKKSYVFITLNYNNYLKDKNTIPYDYIFLRTTKNNKRYNIVETYKDNFYEYGKRFYQTDSLPAETKGKIGLLFEIDREDRNSDMQLEYLLNRDNDSADKLYKYAVVKLDVKRYNNPKLIDTKSLDEELSFKDSLVEGTKLRIVSAEINEKFKVNYVEKIGDKEYKYSKVVLPEKTKTYSKTIIKLVSEFKKDPKYSKELYEEFFNNYLSLEYEIKGKMIKHNILVNDLTPKEAKGEIYIEVKSEVKDADKVNLIFTIRDKQYKYKIIDKTKVIEEETKKEETKKEK